MMRQRVIEGLLALVAMLGLASIAGASDMDPLLELLVAKGVITQEQAEAVQAEYDRTRQSEAAAPATTQPTEPAAADGTAAAADQTKTAATAAPPTFELPKALQGLKIGTLAYISYEDGRSYQGVPNETTHYSRYTLKRGYIDIQKTITPYLMARVTPDLVQNATGDWELRLKYLYGKFSFADWGAVTSPYVEFGIAHMPWLDFEESINRYRMEGTMFLERNGIFNSADVGAMVGGNFGGEMPASYKENVDSHYAGRYGSFQLGVFNGTGYHAPERNSNKVMEARVSVRPVPDVVPGLQLSVLGITGKGDRPEPAPDWDAFDVMVSYESPWVVATGQYYRGAGNQAGTAVLPSGEARKQEGYSLFSEVRFTRSADFSVIGRWDHFDPNREDSASDIQDRTIVGVAWQFLPGNYWLLAYDNLHHDIPSIPNERQLQLTLQLKY